MLLVTGAAGENPLHADRVQLEVVGDQQAVVPQGVECHLAGPQRLVGEPGQVLQFEVIAKLCQVQQGGLRGMHPPSMFSNMTNLFWWCCLNS